MFAYTTADNENSVAAEAFFITLPGIWPRRKEGFVLVWRYLDTSNVPPKFLAS